MYVVPSSFSSHSGPAAATAAGPAIYRRNQQPRRYNDCDAMFSMYDSPLRPLPLPPLISSVLRWTYFVEICQKNSHLQMLNLQDPCRSNQSDEECNDENDPPNAPLNRLTQTRRLGTFVSLASTARCLKESFSTDTVHADDFSLDEEIQDEDPGIAPTSLSSDEESFEWSPYQPQIAYEEDNGGVYVKTISYSPQLYPRRSLSTPSPHSWEGSPIYSHCYGEPYDPYRVSPISVVNPLSCSSPLRPFYAPKNPLAFYS